MKPENALQNAKEAMDLADNWLGVPQVSIKFHITPILCWVVILDKKKKKKKIFNTKHKSKILIKLISQLLLCFDNICHFV